jgi:hypothetical protein
MIKLGKERRPMKRGHRDRETATCPEEAHQHVTSIQNSQCFLLKKMQQPPIIPWDNLRVFFPIDAQLYLPTTQWCVFPGAVLCARNVHLLVTSPRACAIDDDSSSSSMYPKRQRTCPTSTWLPKSKRSTPRSSFRRRTETGHWITYTVAVTGDQVARERASLAYPTKMSSSRKCHVC